MQHIFPLAVLSMLLLTHTAGFVLAQATLPSRAPVVIAHRGASGYLPEHTLPAVALAHAQGADFIEQDVVLSKDHQPIVIHDRVLDHVTNIREVYPDRKRDDGQFHVADFTLAELRTLRVHERIDPRTGRPQHAARFPVNDVPFVLATLGEHIELIQGLNQTTGRDVGLLVELKDPTWHRNQGGDMGRIVLDVLAKYGYTSRTDNALLQSFDLGEIRRLREELKTDLRLVQLLNDQTLKLPRDASREQVSAALSHLAVHADGIGPALEMLLSNPSSQYSGEELRKGLPINNWIDVAHAAGLAVYAYTFRADASVRGVSSFDDLVDAFHDAGLDGFITDHPDRVHALVSLQTQTP